VFFGVSEFHLQLLEKTAKLGLPYTSLLINRFDVAAWLKTSPSFEERETFLRLLLGTIDIRIGLIDANDPKVPFKFYFFFFFL